MDYSNKIKKQSNISFTRLMLLNGLIPRTERIIYLSHKLESSLPSLEWGLWFKSIVERHRNMYQSKNNK
jgi:hypothetical protein